MTGDSDRGSDRKRPEKVEPEKVEPKPAGNAPGTSIIQKAEMPTKKRKTGE